MAFNLFTGLEADDIFISYSRDDGSAYVRGLDAALSARDFSCFTDRRGTEANPRLPATLLRKICSCKTLVLLGTPAALQKPEHITPEVDAFARANGTARIVSVSFDGPARHVLEDWTKTPWYSNVEGKVREREDPKTLKSGQPSPEVVEAIVKASDYMKSKDRLRQYRRRAVWALVILLCLIVGAGATSLVMMERANDQAAIAESRGLANLSQTVLQRRTGTLQQSIGLAIDAVTTAAARGIRTVESDEALRLSLSLLPRHFKSYHYGDPGTATALSPDARHLAILTTDGELRIYRTGDRTPLRHLKVGRASAIAIDSDATHAAVASNASVRILETATGESRLITLETPDPADDMVSISIDGIALSPDGKYLAKIKSVRDLSTQSGMANIENEINDAGVWDVSTGREIAILSQGDRNHTIAFGSTGDLVLASGIRLRGEYSGASGLVSIWRLSRVRATARASTSIRAADFSDVQTHSHAGEIYHVAIGPNAAWYATEGAIWKRNEVGGFVESARFPSAQATSQSPSALAFASDGKSLTVVRSVRAPDRQPAAVALGSEVEIWDTSEHPDRAHAFLPDRIEGLGFLPDGDAISVATSHDRAGNPRVFEVLRGQERNAMALGDPSKDSVQLDVKFVTDDGRFAVSADSRTAYVRDAWRSVTMRVNLGEDVKGGRDCQTALSLDGAFLVVAGQVPGAGVVKVLLYQRHDDAYLPVRQFQLKDLEPGDFRTNHRGDYGGLTITPDGQRLVTRSGGAVLLWDTTTGLEVTPPLLRAQADSDPPRKVTLVKFSRNGRFMAIAHKDGCKRDASGDEECDPEENFMTRAELDRTKHPRVLVLRTSDGEVVADLPHEGQVTWLVFSQQSNYLIATADDANSTLTNLVTGRSTVLTVPDGTIMTAAFSADERHFALGAGTRTRVFAVVDPQKEIASLPDTGFVNAVAFSGDGRLIATSSLRESTSFQDSAANHPARVWSFALDDLLLGVAARIMGIPAYLRDETVAAKARNAAGRAQSNSTIGRAPGQK